MAADAIRGIHGFQDWIVTQALPFWGESGFDSQRGAFHERLSFSGQPVDVPRRAMVQARQVYVFAHAAERNWFPRGAEIANDALASLVRDYADQSAGETAFAFSVDTRGQIVEPARDAYTHAFILLALAWVYRLNGDRMVLRLAAETTAFIDRALTDPIHGGLFSTSWRTDPAKCQNPVMHLLEAYLFLAEVAPGQGYEERATSLVALFERRLFDPVHGVLAETFLEDWSSDGRSRVEPGHLFEWSWLLDWHGRVTGLPSSQADRLRATAISTGFAPSGLIWDEIDAAGSVLRRTHRLWPHCEALKSLAIRDEKGEKTGMTLHNICTVLLDRFVGRPFAAGWIDCVDEAGRPLSGDVPASSLYHLFLAAAELDRTAAMRRTLDGATA
ncbi:AGE family epimerase/isomerase [Sphingomonas nostoxanthinifaciens]|uniref:AGE family epimerase/isomerase n=1 Tax=Sphingomonas nostoxanthinifaciens TaxID=2872652 RepID=UPI001CC1E2E7|nr:AGE family epimerase/isomerase [Sphingomonas nostoxanthinifaciens]UAK25003.1 AGE family epimerase/isomerase [Sphingomonas nostoxanthinifaciens]